MIPRFDHLLERQNFLLLDGALATELEAKGADLKDPLWSAKVLMENPGLLRQVNSEYLEAGADFVTTATYQATFQGFEKRGLTHTESRRLFEQSVEIAMQARDEFWNKKENRFGRIQPIVVASIGPYGAFLADGSEYRGDYETDLNELKNFHRERLSVLTGTDADILAFETIPSLPEAEAIVELLEEFPNATAWVSFSCRDEKRISDGSLFSDTVKLVDSSPQIIAIGINCIPPELVVPLLELAKPLTQKPLMAYPNSGEKWDSGNHCWISEKSSSNFTELAKSWLKAGAKVIGGCCRTSPSDISQLRTLKRETN